MKEENIKQNSFKAWVQASRLKTLSAASAPMLIAFSIALYDSTFILPAAIAALLFALGMQVAANYINDLLDYTKGTDGKEERYGPKSACAQGWISVKCMKRGIIITLAICSLIGLSLLYYAGYQLIFVGVACILFAYLYSGGKRPLSYCGLGDLLVVLFFGVVPITITYYIMAGSITATVFALSLSCGLMVDTILIMNNYRDYYNDKNSGKKTIVVLMGSQKSGSYLYLFVGLAGALIPLILLAYGHIYGAVLPLLFIPTHIIIFKKMQTKSGRALNPIFMMTSRNVILYALLQCAGIMLDLYL